MKEITTSKGDFLFVPVPDAIGYWIEGGMLKWEIPHLVWSGNPPEPSHDEWEYGELQTPEGNYEFICTTDTITQELAEQIVDNMAHGFVDYQASIFDFIPYEFPLSSFASLLRSNTLTTPHAILKKIK